MAESSPALTGGRAWFPPSGGERGRSWFLEWAGVVKKALNAACLSVFYSGLATAAGID